MSNNEFHEVANILGNRKDYFQGAGGNISLKRDGDEMPIKASGVRVSDMADERGVVSVTYKNISKHFVENEVEHNPSKEKESVDLVIASALQMDGRRPSIETGFHALLGKAVIHSHSVYANILTCSESFYDLTTSLFPDSPQADIRYASIDYAAPGYFLTHKMKGAILKTNIGNANDNADPHKKPLVIFMKNHGITVSASSLEEAMKIHEFVGKKIIDHFKTTNKPIEPFPISSLQQINDKEWKSGTPFLREFVKNNIAIFTNIQNYMLFPDAVVFCKDLKVSTDRPGTSKIVVRPQTGDITYNTNKKEAEFIEENLLAWSYLIKSILSLELVPHYISEEHTKKIESMESEEYRKKLIA